MPEFSLARIALSPKRLLAWGRGLGEGASITENRHAPKIRGANSSPGPLSRRRQGRGFSIFIALIFAFACTLAHAQDETTQRGADLEVAIYTFGPGEEVWERFGHNAIEIRDRTTGAARLYNYGIFDFAQENFFLNFAKGLMTYRIAAGDPADELPVYVAEGRWIVRQQLNFTPAQRAKLADFLADNARPEKAQYRYDYFRANCSTKVRDALDLALDGAIKTQTIAPSRGYTYRMDADRLMRADPAIMLAIDAGLGPYSDQRLSYWDESFVPMEFMRHLRDIKVRDEAGNAIALIANETQIAQARIAEPPELPPRWIWQALALGLGGGAGLLALARMRERVWARITFASCVALLSFVLGIGGLVLTGLWLLTDHVSAWRNENLLLFSPLCLLLLPTWLASFRRQWRPSRFAQSIALVIAALAAFAWFAKILPPFRQDNYFWIGLLLPLHLALAFCTTRLSRR
jgi:hypothetical protein